MYLLDREGSGEFRGTEEEQSLAGLLASHDIGEEYEQQIQSFVELALKAVGKEGQRRLGGAEGRKPAELQLVADLWYLARLLPGKDAILVVVCHPNPNLNLGWAAVSAAITQISPALLIAHQGRLAWILQKQQDGEVQEWRDLKAAEPTRSRRRSPRGPCLVTST